MKRKLVYLTMLCITVSAWGKVDLVTLPSRDTVQLTIYNSADLTLARESRSLTLKDGENSLQFSWAGTLIDPTSLDMLPKAHAAEIDIAELVFPPRVQNLGLWNIASEVSGKVPVEISYLTSGLTWRAFYMGTLSPDEKTMHLQGYVRVTNNSGEDYDNAQVRLIVGEVHLIDQIAELARQQYPYGSPVQVPSRGLRTSKGAKLKEELEMVMESAVRMDSLDLAVGKQIVKEGLSEYFLYTIPGTETIPNGWSKRLKSFDASDVPVVNLCRYDEQRYGTQVIRFLSFTNDEDHKLGQTPIPDGMLKVYRGIDDQKHLSYVGQSGFKYIPVGQEVELNLGPARDVVVEPKLMTVKTDNYRFDRRGNVAGWDDVQTYGIEVKNTRDVPVEVEIYRSFPTTYWTLAKSGDFGAYEKIDMDTVKFKLSLAPGSSKVFEYAVTFYQGTRQGDWNPDSN